MCDIHRYVQKTPLDWLPKVVWGVFFPLQQRQHGCQRLNKSFSKQLAVCFILFHIYGFHHLPPEMDLTVPMRKWAFITGRKKNGVNKALKINWTFRTKSVQNKISFAVLQAFGKAFGFLISQVSVSLFVSLHPQSSSSHQIFQWTLLSSAEWNIWGVTCILLQMEF